MSNIPFYPSLLQLYLHVHSDAPEFMRPVIPDDTNMTFVSDSRWETMATTFNNNTDDDKQQHIYEINNKSDNTGQWQMDEFVQTSTIQRSGREHIRQWPCDSAGHRKGTSAGHWGRPSAGKEPELGTIGDTSALMVAPMQCTNGGTNSVHC